MVPVGMYPQVLRQLANAFANTLLLTFGRSQQSAQVPEDQKKSNVTLIFKKEKKEDLGNYSQLALSQSGKVMEPLILETIYRHRKVKKVIRISQH